MRKTKDIKKQRWALSYLYFATGLTFATWASRIPDIKTRLCLSDGELGIGLFAIPTGQLAMMAISGWLVTRWGSRLCVAASLMFYAAVLPTIGLASSQILLFVALFMFGAMANLANISLNTQATSLESRYGRTIMSSFHGFWSLGGLTGGTLGALFANSGLPLQVHLSAIALLVSVTALYSSSHLEADKPASKEDRPKIRLRDIDLPIVLLGLMAFGGMFCEGIVFDWSSIYFATVINPPEELIRLGYIAGMCAMMAMRFVADKISTRYGQAFVLRTSGLLIVGGVWLAVWQPTLVPATLGFLLVGMGISATVPVCYSLAGRHDKLPASVAIAAVSTIGFLGFLSGPPLIGLLSEQTNLRTALAMSSSLGQIITTLTYFIKFKKN